MIINTFRWVKERCRSWSSASETHKMGWLEVGTKLHCVEQSGNWYRFDIPVMPLIDASYPHTWVHGDYLEIISPPPEPPVPPIPIDGDVAQALATVIRFIKAIWRE